MMHIHNGDVVAAVARRSGIPGEHVAYRESLVTGPVVPGDGWLEARAHALADRHGEELLRVRTALLEQEQLLDAAPAQGEIVLWFEHDLFCLVHFIHLLQRFADARLSVVWCPDPLAYSDERGLHLLFESRSAATPAMVALARDAWAAYTSPDASELNRFVDRDAPELAFLRNGLTLHASRFPSTRNGLGAVEQTALEIVAGGTTDWSALFDQLNARMPRLGFGDEAVFASLRAIATCAVPLVSITGELPKAIVTITPAGENVMRAEVDDLRVNDPDRWLGGVHLTKENVWRWDGAHLSRSAAS
jgi:hypothetical protein